MTKRRSNITKLPKDVQLAVNTMLDEGATYQSVIDWLTAKGFPGITTDCMYHWKEGGFQDWLAERRRTERARALFQWSADFTLAHPHTTPHAATVLFATSQLKDLLDEIDVLQAQSSFAEHPENYARCFNALARFARLSFDMQKHEEELKFETQKHKDTLALQTADLKQASDSSNGEAIRPESFDAIEKKLNLL